MLTDAVRDPPRAVACDDLDGLALLPRQLLEEEVEHLLAVALVRPHDRVRLVIDDDRDVAVALAVAGLVDADQLQPLVALLRVRLEHLPRELDEPTDSLPVDAQQLGTHFLLSPPLTSHAVRLMKSRVKREPDCAHGTIAVSTPCFLHLIRGTLATILTVTDPKSMPRHALSTLTQSYTGHLRPHSGHRHWSFFEGGRARSGRACRSCPASGRSRRHRRP